MISVSEALELILKHKADFGIEKVALLESPGRLLAENIHADRDQPPFNRVMMDGIAISFVAFEAGMREFRIENIQAAGEPQKELQDLRSGCIEVMTGAMLPAGTDAVIPYEQCVIKDGRARIDAESIKPGQNIHRQGLDGKAGDILLEKGTEITAGSIAALASAGYDEVAVRALPVVAVCSTGDELVDIDRKPQVHQIRRSNSYMLAAALQKEGIDAGLFHLPDNQDELARQIMELKKDPDVLLFSGAVSRGKFDFLPDTLRMLDMHTLFHTVAQKPGKPFLAGFFSDGPLVFGFPGNPVSTFACYQVYFRSWLYASIGKHRQNEQAVLTEPLNLKAPVAHHVLVEVYPEETVLKAKPVLPSNSGDLGSLSFANGVALFSAEKACANEGDMVDIIRF